MKTENTKLSNLIVPKERNQFLSLLAVNSNYFGNIQGSKLKSVKKIVSNTNYEEISCVGYNPYTAEMEATFNIKLSSGYSGELCSAGSREYVRFYLDFHDGLGFIDQGSVAINVHDIPAGKDCKGESIFPLSYVAKAKKVTAKFPLCTNPLLPTLRAILSWQVNPPANSPNWTPVWGSKKDCEVQIAPFIFKASSLFPSPILDLSATAISAMSKTEVKKLEEMNTFGLTGDISKLSLAEEISKAKKSGVPASRFAFDAVQKMIKYPLSEITLENQKAFSSRLADSFA